MPSHVHEQPLKERRRKERNEQTLTIYNSLKGLENIYSQTRQQKNTCTCMYMYMYMYTWPQGLRNVFSQVQHAPYT